MKALIGRYRLYLAVVVVPLLLTCIYVLLIRSPGYVSSAKVIVERDPLSGGPSIDLGFLSPVSGGDHTDALVIRDFMLSHSLAEALDAAMDLRSHWSHDSRDPFSRLSETASREDYVDFYRNRVHVTVDDESLVITLEAEGYTPEFAQQLAAAIVKHAEDFENDISHQLAREQMAFVQSELDRANERVRKATTDLIEIQQRNAIFSPQAESATAAGIVASLQTELAARSAELTGLRSYLNERAPEVVALRKRVEALREQIEKERAGQVGGAAGSDRGLAQLMLEYQDAEMAVKVASDVYQAALASLETARLDASRKAKYLVQVAQPNLPQDSLRPRRGWFIVTTLVLLHLLYFVATLIVVTVRDHRD